ncbi:hypothetical protein PIB30_064768, partial [Stylosanthes scabra]|nr:hypothetical protein [Stylosanthes scabra]
MQEVRVEQHYHQVRNPKDYNVRQWDAIHRQKIQGALRRVSNPTTILICGTPVSKRSSRGHEQDNPKRIEEKTRRKERVLGRRTLKRPMGLWNLGAIINRVNTFPTNLRDGSHDSLRNRGTNHL